MKRWELTCIICLSILAGMILMEFILLFAQPEKPIDNLYPLYTEVVEVCPTSDLVVVKAFNGNLFSFHGVEDWQVGDICSILMDDNDTEFVFDDIIVKTRYGGWVE